jgi:hypothetical protein
MNLSTLSMAVLLLAGPVVAAAQDLETLYQDLKDAQAKKDAALVKKLAVQTNKLAREAIAKPAPADADAKEAWTKHVDYAKEVNTYSEYALYATAIQSPPAAMADLIATLEQQNPKSKYLDEANSNEDVLVVLANNALTRKQNDSALRYANRLVAAMGKRTKPDSMSAEDWDRRRAAMLGRGYWIAGVVNGEKGVYKACDTNLRAALPYIKGEPSMAGVAYFYLGVANYQLGKMMLSKAKVLEGAKFSDESAKIQGPYAQQAWRNAALMKDEAGRMR